MRWAFITDVFIHVHHFMLGAGFVWFSNFRVVTTVWNLRVKLKSTLAVANIVRAACLYSRDFTAKSYFVVLRAKLTRVVAKVIVVWYISSDVKSIANRKIAGWICNWYINIFPDIRVATVGGKIVFANSFPQLAFDRRWRYSDGDSSAPAKINLPCLAFIPAWAISCIAQKFFGPGLFN